MAQIIRRRAHAKINLALRVWPAEPKGGDRPGWHRICSWAACIDLHDDLEVAPGGAGLALERSWASDAPRAGPIDWPEERDLVWRAVRALEARIARPLPCRIHLNKRIPAGGGLGGGSSDAAATLLACNAAFDLGLTAPELRDVARTLGSDVPFFVDDTEPARAAIIRGFGDDLERCDPVRGDLTLILPRAGCATPAVYGAFDQSNPAAPDEREVGEMVAAARMGRFEGAMLRNDLFEPACAVEPAVREVWLRASRALPGRPVRMSGSGSTLWVPGGLDASEAARLEAELSTGAPGPGGGRWASVTRASLV
jgi:4-diphosphocytidyl-2-C-methyl-D-erythritol kinase